MSFASSLDDSKVTRFHLKVAAYSTGGMFCDGYMLGIVAPALAAYATHHELGSVWTGLIGASALIGLFLGSIFFGWLTDRVGRQTMYLFTLFVFVAGSLAQGLVNDPALIFALRLLLGIAIGADYAISPTLLAEFCPRRYRGALLSLVNVMWTIGYVASFLVGYLMADLGPNAWKFMLMTSAVPALVVALMRLGTPESPRWLAQQGRTDEALAVIREYIDPNATPADVESEPAKRSYRELLRPGTRRRVAFGGLFWFCQVVPYFAVFTFLPTVLKALGITEDLSQTVIVNIFLLAGAVAGTVLVTYLRRRVFALWTFAMLAAVAVALALWTGASAGMIVVMFAVFAFVVSAQSALAAVYPSELFPTAVRASGVGACTAISRIGAAIGTFLLPISVTGIGVHPTTLIAAGVLVLGFLVTLAWGPETHNVNLSDASAVGTRRVVPEPGAQVVPADG